MKAKHEQAPRSIPLAKRNEFKDLVDEMKRSGVIETSSGLWRSPVVLALERWRYNILFRLQDAE